MDQPARHIVSSAAEPLPYRVCVGMMLVNDEGRVWLGRRLPKWMNDPSARIWQMPQGGIEAGELPVAAAFRELEEETGIKNVELIGEHPEWLSYDLPAELLGVALKGRYRGQQQKWFALRHLGSDEEISIAPRKAGLKPEFDAWRWADIDEIVGLAVPFKRHVYHDVTSHFRELIRQR